MNVDSAERAMIGKNEDEMQRLIRQQRLLPARHGGCSVGVVSVRGGSADAQRQHGPQTRSHARRQAVQQTAAAVEAAFAAERLEEFRRSNLRFGEKEEKLGCGRSELKSSRSEQTNRMPTSTSQRLLGSLYYPSQDTIICQRNRFLHSVL